MQPQANRLNRLASLLEQMKGLSRQHQRSALTALVMIGVLLCQAAAVPFASAAGRESRAVKRLRPQSKSPARATFNDALKAQDFTTQAVTVEAAIVRHAPSLNSGRVEGSVRQLTGEAVTLNSGAVITSNLLVPGTPQLQINGSVTFGGTVQGTGSTQPSGSSYRVTLNGPVTLGHLVTRTDPIAMPTVAPPPTPTGTRNVTLNTPGQSIGDPATLRNLTLNSNVGIVSVPPGTYGAFTVNGGSGLSLGVANSAQPSIYNLQSLTLNSGSQVQIVGPVVLTLNTGMNLNSSIGTAANPLWLRLNIAAGGLTLNGSSSLYGIVQAPSGTVTLNGNTLLQGSITCDRFTLNSGGLLKGAGGTMESLSPTRATQGQSLAVTLKGINTHWVDGNTKASFGGEVTVGGAAAGDFGPVQVIDANTATAQVSVSPTAALAPRSVQMSTTVFSPDEVETETLIDGFTVVSATPPGAAASAVTTIAGLAGTPGFADGAAGVARFRDLAGIAVGPDDTIYVADAGNHRIRRIAADGAVSTLAGNSTAGFADGQGSAARFNNPQGVAVDASGVVYVADTGNHRIRRIAADGTVSTLAGDGTAGFVNGTGGQARFNAPRGLAVDTAGNVYVADSGNSAVRVINGGSVSTLAGDGTMGSTDSPTARFNGLAGIAVDGATLYIYAADTGNHRIRRLTPSGTVITIAGADRGFADGSATSARFADPSGIAIDGAGKLVIADATNSLVRAVDAELAIGGSPVVVTTIAGTGERGATSGAGNVAQFFTPRGVAVSPSSAILVADTGNQVVRRILLPPLITSFNPAQAHTLDNVTINGERFDGRAPSGNVVSFTKVGGGQTLAQVTAASRTQLTVVVPADAATGPVTVQTQGGTATSATDFIVLPLAPTINDFNPKHGPIGSSVTLTGTNLQVAGGTTTVTFAGSNGTRLPALINSLTATQAVALVPNAAVTGTIELTTPGGQAVTNQPFTVEVEGYQLTVAPSAASAVQRTHAIYVVAITSATTFSQLATLSASGLPSGVTASFSPQQITAGASSTLSLNLANVDLAAGSYSFSIQATALVDGSPLVRTAAATLSVIAAGQTTLSGRVLSTELEAIIGATVSLDGHTATTDAAGSFLLTGVTAGVDRPLMIDGRTASAPNRTYPVILEPATIVAGQANAVPFTFYLPAIDTQYEVDVVPGQNTIATNPRVPGLQMTIPAGANLRNRDGSPVARASITPLAIDRTPAPLPANVGTTLVYTSQPGGAVADIAMPVIYPNLAGADPDTRVPLYAFNHDTVQWYVYGYGRVSADGRTIVPEVNPATGRQYGLLDFSWHFPGIPPTDDPSDIDCDNQTDNPVDLTTGLKTERSTDIHFGGARGSIELTRIYTSNLVSECPNCPFGAGTTHSYDIRLRGSFEAGGAGRVVFPGQRTGRLFSYLRTDADGALVFSTTAARSQLGDLLRKLTDGTFDYRQAGGGRIRFDSDGNSTAIIDVNGNTTTLSYSGGNLTQITDAVGRSITLQYDSSSRIIRATDPLGRAWRYAYAAPLGLPVVPLLVNVTDPLNQVMSYSYDALGKLLAVFDKRNFLLKQIGYDANGRVAVQRFAEDGYEQYDYTLSGTVVTAVTITDSLGRSVTRRFNARGYTVETTDALGQQGRIERDITTNLPVSSTGPCGCSEARRQFDERGNTLAMTDRSGQTTHFEYEPIFNNVTKITDKLGRVTQFAYDAHGNLTTITNALNQTTTLAYDSFGELTSMIDALGHTTRLEYDAYGNIAAVIDALNHRATFEYDLVGRNTAIVDPLSRRSHWTFDELDRVISKTDTAGASSSFTYDANDNLLTTTDALQRQTQSAYDTKNRLVSITDAIGRVSQIQYDTEDQVTTLTSPSGRTVSYIYEPRGLVETIQDALGNLSRMSYDHRGNLLALSDQRGFTTTYAYDELYRPITRRDPLGRKATASYDANGNLLESVDRLGRHTTMTYDALNRITHALYVDAAVTYTYDAASRLTRVDDTQDGSLEWTYDDADRLLTETTPAGVVSYAYNIAGEMISMTAADRAAVSYGYDAAGRLQSIAQAGESFTYTYDLLSRLIGLQRPNDVNSSYSYDAVDRLARLTHAKVGGPAVEDYQYAYTDDDEFSAITSLASVPLLPQAKTASAADAANRLGQLAQAGYTFDHEGQTTAKSEAAGTTQYEWDGRGRLRRVTLAGGQVISYGYDAAGRRASRTAAGQTTSFLYSGAEVVADRTSGGSVDYLNGQGLDEHLRQTSGSGPLYYLQDHLGSTIALTDTGGGVLERQAYEPFGASSGSSLTRYGYTGRELDAETGLLYLRARWYDAAQGRFISEDPLGFGGGDVNLYAYVGNAPMGHTDRLGLELDETDMAEAIAWIEEQREEALKDYLGIVEPDELIELFDPCLAEMMRGYRMPAMQAGFGSSLVKQLLNLKRLTKLKKLSRLRKLAKAIKDVRFRKPPAIDNYRGRFNADRALRGEPRLPNDWDAHHRIPRAYEQHPEFRDFDFHDPSNIRGVKGSRSGENVHQLITNEWEDFRTRNPHATREQIERFAKGIDRRYGNHWFK
jgi:RHS repeat-associated protein